MKAEVDRMRVVDYNKLEDDVTHLDMSIKLLMVVQSGLEEYIDHNIEIIDGAIYSVINLQRDIIERIKKDIGISNGVSDNE